MMEIQAKDVLRINRKTRFRRVFEEAVVIHEDKNEALVLNETGAAFLEACDGEKTFEQLIQCLESQFETETETLRRDMSEFASALLSEEIIER